MIHTQQTLNSTNCETPGCECDSDILVLNPGCHVGAPMFAEYSKKSGTYTLYCGVCEQRVTEVLVAPDAILN